MGRSPCCDENGLKKGPWTPEEDQNLVQHIKKHGHGSWRALPKLAGLNRCGKSCRLRWTNYLRPDIKRGKFSEEEEERTILNLHSFLGNKWSAIATHLPGRTDNEIKNFWNTHLKKKLIQMGFDPMTHHPRTDLISSLSNLMALANLKDLMDHHTSDDHAVRLQAEAIQLTRLQYLQYLLQPPTTSSSTNTTDMEASNLWSSISSTKESTPSSLGLGTINQFIFDSSSIPFSHLPDLQVSCNFQKTLKTEIGHCQSTAFISQGEPTSTSIWVPSSSPPLLTETNALNNNIQGDTCSASSYGGGGTPFGLNYCLTTPLSMILLNFNNFHIAGVREV